MPGTARIASIAKPPLETIQESRSAHDDCRPDSYAYPNTPPPDRGDAMILAIALALLPVAFVAAMATRDMRPWRRTLKHIRALPESCQPEHGSTSRR